MNDPETHASPRASAQRLQFVGLVLVLVAGCLPSFSVRPEGPADFFLRGVEDPDPGPYRARLLIGRTGARPAPLADWGTAVGALVTGDGTLADVWQRRASYPFVLALGWLIAFLLAGRGVSAASRWLWSLTLVLIGVEAAYLRIDYEGLFPDFLGAAEVWLVFSFVVIVLLLPPRWSGLASWRRLLAAQALLSILHLVTLPCTYVRPVVLQQSLGETLHLIQAQFGPAFWVAFLGCVLIVLPIYWPTRSTRGAAARVDQGL